MNGKVQGESKRGSPQRRRLQGVRKQTPNGGTHSTTACNGHNGPRALAVAIRRKRLSKWHSVRRAHYSGAALAADSALGHTMRWWKINNSSLVISITMQPTRGRKLSIVIKARAAVGGWKRHTNVSIDKLICLQTDRQPGAVHNWQSKQTQMAIRRVRAKAAQCKLTSHLRKEQTMVHWGRAIDCTSKKIDWETTGRGTCGQTGHSKHAPSARTSLIN